MLDAVYVETVEEPAIVVLKPKSAFQALFQITTGRVVSCTVTVKDADPTLPAASSAVQITVATLIEKVEPEARVQLGPTVTPTASVAVGGG